MRINKSLKFRWLNIVVFILSISGIQAQVTIGSDIQPEKAAILDIKSHQQLTDGGPTTKEGGGGLLLSRVVLTDRYSLKPFFIKGETNYDTQAKRHIGLTVYNIQDDTNPSFDEGLYIWDGIQWAKITGKPRDKFFYMPSVPINTTELGEAADPVELFKIYKEQFLDPKVKSTNAPEQIPVFEKDTDLYYYVTSYDEDVFENIKITENGSMTYSVKKIADPWSFINIVFVIK